MDKDFINNLINNLNIVLYLYDKERNIFIPKYTDKNILMREYINICIALFNKNIKYELTEEYHIKIF